MENPFLNQVTIPTTTIGYSYDIRIASWKNGLNAWRVSQGEVYEPLDGGLGVDLSFIGDEKEKARWLSLIPCELLEKTNAFSEYQYQMLWLAANSRNAWDILMQRPLIIALVCMTHSIDNKKALTVANCGQREILKYLGLASSKSALKFIDKLELSYARGSEISHVINMLDAQTNYYKRFSHYRKVNFASLSLDNTHPFLTQTRLGRKLSDDPNVSRSQLTGYIVDTLMLGDMLGFDDPMATIGNLGDLQALKQLHDDWVEQRNQHHDALMKPVDIDKSYPQHLRCPIQMTQIVCYDELCEEGKTMQHCIEIYHNRIVRQKYAAFRFNGAERATVGLKINSRKTFPYEIDQISGVKNKIVTQETRKFVFDWLQSERNRFKGT
ncbi:PcfJ domain-containing protein [Paraferrimonas haliotis]|uniref:PcfJ domain-containing protein n=1 Tax=Paraferrimonas haliotis TaxID=2013866 RepID=UPI000BA8D268|nr:PcfJ domain-containing protein [Paraferrimonas haliotis]